MNEFDRYSNYDLAFLFKYKLMTYLPNTREKLRECCEGRDLNDFKINQFST